MIPYGSVECTSHPVQARARRPTPRHCRLDVLRPECSKLICVAVSECVPQFGQLFIPRLVVNMARVEVRELTSQARQTDATEVLLDDLETGVPQIQTSTIRCGMDDRCSVRDSNLGSANKSDDRDVMKFPDEPLELRVHPDDEGVGDVVTSSTQRPAGTGRRLRDSSVCLFDRGEVRTPVTEPTLKGGGLHVGRHPYSPELSRSNGR